MKINGTFTLREVAGEILVIPVGETSLQLNGMIILNPVSKVLWERLEKGATADELLTAVTDLFEVNPKEAEADIAEFLDSLRQQKLLSDTIS